MNLSRSEIVEPMSAAMALSAALRGRTLNGSVFELIGPEGG
jgi:hypothetical protein